MTSVFEENYLKAIHKLCEKNEVGAYTNDIAHELNIKPASVSESLKKLSDKNLIFYTKYKAVTLTKQGQLIALKTIRKHRLWEVFLVEKLGFKWDEIHPMAEELEHISFDVLIERLSEFLGDPEFDPHGDPIPDKNGKIKANKSVKLSAASKNVSLTMTGIENDSPAFLQHLNKLGLALGIKLMIMESVDFDKSILVKVGEDKEFYLSYDIASNILCR
ncbi:MAG: metal-dependent transcriptional regulator [Cytophagales bacterium]|nr:metal-dependent transcriptional regulator [Cytophaga sp.]